MIKEIKGYMKMMKKGLKKFEKKAEKCGIDLEERRRHDHIYGYWGLDFNYISAAKGETDSDKMGKLKTKKLKAMKKKKLAKTLAGMKEDAKQLKKAMKQLKKACAE